MRPERGRRVRDASVFGLEQRQRAAPRVLDLATVRVDVLVVAGVLLAAVEHEAAAIVDDEAAIERLLGELGLLRHVRRPTHGKSRNRQLARISITTLRSVSLHEHVKSREDDHSLSFTIPINEKKAW